MTKEEQLKQFLKEQEGCRLKAYLDSADIPTIGTGTIRYPNGVFIKLGETCTQEQADVWLDYYLKTSVYPKVNLFCIDADNVWIALCSFVYNVGKIGSSIKVALDKRNLNDLAAAFRLYNKIRNKDGNLVVCQGLVNRREAEIKLFLPKEK